MTEYEFYLSLRTKFDAKEYALLPQVRNGTGFKKKPRTADAIAVSLWPSRGIDVHGFEFKDSRTDWLKELKEPEKADEIGKHCDFWWVVISDKEIVKGEELPSAWGLMLAGEKIKVLKQAPRRESQTPDWGFVAAVLRSAVGVVTDEEAIQKRIQQAAWKAKEEANDFNLKCVERERKTHKDEVAALMSKIKDFEEASGIRIETWRHSYGDNRKMGEAVALILRGGFKREIEAFETALQRMDSLRTVAVEMRGITESLAERMKSP